jgi:hypothetical protein
MLSGRGLCDELISRPEGPTDCGASCVIKRPRERGGHVPRWATEPEMIMIMMMMIIIIIIILIDGTDLFNVGNLVWWKRRL